MESTTPHQSLLFVWTGLTSYMTDCWRELAGRADVRLKILVEDHPSGRGHRAGDVLAGLDARLLPFAAPASPETLAEIAAFAPDTIFAVGWHAPLSRSVVRAFPSVRKICCFDMPWRTSLRCFAARFVLGRYVRLFDAAYVPGAWAARYARWLGFRRVRTGLFAVDVARYRRAADTAPAPRAGFFFFSRHAPEKRLDLLEEAYRRYRADGGTWPLDVYGGDNFVAAADAPRTMAAHAAIILPSAFDPWPIVIVEALAAGCAAIVSDRCGTVAELATEVVPYGDADALARAMRKTEEAFRRGEKPLLPALDRYTCAAWADRTRKMNADSRSS